MLTCAWSFATCNFTPCSSVQSPAASFASLWPGPSPSKKHGWPDASLVCTLLQSVPFLVVWLDRYIWPQHALCRSCRVHWIWSKLGLLSLRSRGFWSGKTQGFGGMYYFESSEAHTRSIHTNLFSYLLFTFLAVQDNEFTLDTVELWYCKVSHHQPLIYSIES